MKQWCFLVILSGMSNLLIPMQEKKKEYSFAQFSTDFETYYPEPGWIARAFVSLSLDDFDKAWELFVATLRASPKKFFVSGKEVYSEKKYRETFIAHCGQYDVLLEDLLVDVKNKRIFLVSGAEKKQFLKQPGIVRLFEYWKAKKITTYHHFYAFYFDTLVIELYETIITAYREHDTTDYPALYKKAKLYNTMIAQIFRHLRGGEYDGRYAYHLKRYKEVLEVLQKERKEQEGGLNAVGY